MNALKEMKLIENIMTLSEEATPRKILDFLGDDKIYEKEVAELFPRFSWSGRRALRMALIIEEEGKGSTRAQAAGIELAGAVPFLRDIEFLAVLTVLKRGRDELEPLIKLSKAVLDSHVSSI